MLKDSLLQRYNLFICAACVGAHANLANEKEDSGFRPRDVKFLFELCLNWSTSLNETSSLTLQNVQVTRFLDQLVKEAFARRVKSKSSSGSRARYRLTRVGLLELISRMVNYTEVMSYRHLLFLFYFLGGYKDRITSIIESEGRLFPTSLKIEIESLLDEQALLERALGDAKRELQRLKIRISDSISTAELSTKILRQGGTLEDIISQAEKLYPYELNSQRPLHELMQDFPPLARAWELEKGNIRRVKYMWNPEVAMLKTYIQQLEALLKSAKET